MSASWLSGLPRDEVSVPRVVTTVTGGAALQCVWRGALGGLTFAVDGARRFVKWSPATSGIDLRGEASRMRWALPYTPVPAVVDTGVTDDGATWLLTEGLAGTSAVADRWKADPRVAVRAIGEGLRAMHDALPVASCPFSWSAESRVGRVQERVALGLMHPQKWQDAHRDLSVDDALAVLADPPAEAAVVVCHGDACAPNTLLADDGCWSGHVDLGELGVADAWADLAIATWSSAWNYGEGWEHELLAAYGVASDPDRTRWYRLLWDLGD